MNTKLVSPVAVVRKMLPFLLCAILTGCAVVQPRERITNVLFLDYRPYVSADFHISPDAYTQSHHALGELMIEVYPAIKSNASRNRATTEAMFTDGIYGGGGISASRVYRETITSKELLEIAVSKALELGADGISNFEAKVIYNTTYTKYGTTQTLSHYEIKGLCIDRQ